MTSTLSHYARGGETRMVDVGGKTPARREATARARLRFSPRVWRLLPRNPKGDPLEVARIAGIQAAKRTPELVPLCHVLPLEHVGIEFRRRRGGLEIVATAAATALTGVEMEALVAVSMAALTVYDMLKAAAPGMTIECVELMEKRGGKSGLWRRGHAAGRAKAGKTP